MEDLLFSEVFKIMGMIFKSISSVLMVDRMMSLSRADWKATSSSGKAIRRSRLTGERQPGC
jgi:hypothetical protein